MNRTPEDIAKSLLKRGVRLQVDGTELVLAGKTSDLSEDQVAEVRTNKVELIGYLAENPLDQTVLYVANDLEWWTTDDPWAWDDTVVIDGKKFVRLAPSVIAWFKKRVALAEKACDEGKLPLEQYRDIVTAFSAVYAWAIETGLATPAISRANRESARRAK